jgi:hypothetical protein
MRWEEWKFSARLGWQDPYVRWIGLATVLLVCITGGFFLFRLLPEGWRSGVITMHYNIYLGIDDVRPWPWLFVVPGTALGAVVIDVLLALGLYRRHALASRTVLAAGLAASAVWAIGIFFLIRVNF